MIDVFLPFESLSPDSGSHPEPTSPQVSEIISKIDELKQFLHDPADAPRLLALSQNIHQAIEQLTAHPRSDISRAKSSPASDRSDVRATWTRLILYAWGAQQKVAYFEKLWNYFQPETALFRAPEKLLAAHGLQEKVIQGLRNPALRQQRLKTIQTLVQFLSSQNWEVLQVSNAATAHLATEVIQELPALWMVRGKTELLSRTKMCVLGDKQQLPSMFQTRVAECLEIFRTLQVVPVCHLSQQSSLQFALQAARKEVPCILVLNFDPLKTADKRYRFLNYFLDRGCLLLSGELPFEDLKKSHLGSFRLAMHLSRAVMVFPKWEADLGSQEYVSKYWPVFSHCRQHAKMCTILLPDHPGALVAFKHLDAYESTVVAIEHWQHARLLFQALEQQGTLSPARGKELLGKVSELLVVH